MPLDNSPAPTTPALPADVSLQVLDDAGILFRASTRQLFAVNTTATFIWCLLEDGHGAGAIRDRLQHSFRLTRSAAAACLDTALRQWRDHGLLSAPLTRASGIGPLRLLDHDFRLRLAPHLAGRRDEIAGLLAPLAQTAANRQQTTLLLQVDGPVLRRGRRVIEQCDAPDQLVPMLKTGLMRLALEYSRDLLALHAAGLLLDGHGLLLCGPSGSGKSTLAAALAFAGLPLLGDDTIILGDALQLRPAPFAICLKSGAWSLLQDRFPQLAGLATHHRLDDRHVRYLLPPDPASWVAPDSLWPARWIVFPERSRGATARLRPLARAAALDRLLHEAAPLDGGLDATRVARLVDWIRGINCHALEYDDLAGATDCLLALDRRG